MWTENTFSRTLSAWPLLAVALLFLGPMGLFPETVHAQEDLQAQRETTEERLEALKEQIQRDQERLEQTEEEERATRQRLEDLQREIALREELVSTYQQRLSQLEDERRHLRDTLQTLERRLDELREEYRDRVVHAYKYSRVHDLALILASQSINQMLIRIRYLQRFASTRREQREAIQAAAADVRSSREQLEQKREETQELLADARTERENLQALEADRREMIQELRARGNQLQEEIEEKQQQARRLEERVQQIAARLERRDGRGSPEERAERAEASANLSASFEQNRGQLPWPAEGAIVEGFGTQRSSYGTSLYHPGILIATNPGSDVQAVFQGTVSGIDFIPGFGTYVVIRHGDYMSVYSNFSDLYISEGDAVEAGEVIGAAGTEDEPKGAGIFFAVFDRSTSEAVDPTTWLAAR